MEYQKTLVNKFNEGKSNTKQIPLCIRNRQTDWPLMQASALTHSPENPEEYTPALGGEKCKVNGDLAGVIYHDNGEMNVAFKIPSVEIKTKAEMGYKSKIIYYENQKMTDLMDNEARFRNVK